MEPRKHLWLPAMAAAILAAGLVMPAAHASDPLRAGQKTVGDPNQRAIADPNTRVIGDPKTRLQKVPPPVGPDIRKNGLRPRGERGIILWRNKTKGGAYIIHWKRPRRK